MRRLSGGILIVFQMLMLPLPAIVRSLFLINDRHPVTDRAYCKKIMRKYIQWFGKAVRQHWNPMAVMMICHLFLAGCAVAFVYICKELVDIAVAVFKGVADREGLFIWLGMMAGVIILRILLNALRTYLQTRTEMRVKNSLRRRLFDILLRMDAEGSKKYHSGDILNRIQEDVRVLSSTIAVFLPNLLGTAFQLVAALAFLLYLDLRLAASRTIRPKHPVCDALKRQLWQTSTSRKQSSCSFPHEPVTGLNLQDQSIQRAYKKAPQ